MRRSRGGAAKSLRAAALPEGSEVISIHRHIAAGVIAVTLAAACAGAAAPALAAEATVTAVTQVSVSLSWPATPGAASYLVAWDGGSAVTTGPRSTPT